MQLIIQTFAVMWFLLISIGINLSWSQNKIEKSVKIGLLISNKEDTEASDAIQLAFDETNAVKNETDPKFQLLVRHTEGPWGVGSKEAVNFIYNDQVVALMGSLDGRTAHLAEQVTAKVHYIFLSTWSTDPTLTQAYVPWFFRIIPNDVQQAKVLVNEIYKSSKTGGILVISDDSYDSNLSSKSFYLEIEKKGIPQPQQFILNSKKKDMFGLKQKLTSSKPKIVVLFLQADFTEHVIKQIEVFNNSVPVYGNIASFALFKKTNVSNKIVTVESGDSSKERLNKFQSDFTEKYGHQPGSKAIFAYEGALLLCNAIKQVGTESEDLKTFLLQSDFKEGIIGSTQFDEYGNRLGGIELIQIKNGIPLSSVK
jgi:branched-chain amino acid transport system substrate-binding protein